MEKQKSKAGTKILAGCLATVCGLMGCSQKKTATVSGSTTGNSNPIERKFGTQEITTISNIESPLVDKFLHLLAQISMRTSELEREKDRRGKLRIALGVNVGAGCMADVVVKNMEVLLDGEKIGDLDVTSEFVGKNAPAEETGASLFEFSVGDTEWNDVLTFANDEAKNALFSVGTRKSFVPNRENFTIGKIQRLKIRKTKSSYSSVDLCENATFTESCSNRRKIKEMERYYLGKLEIKVNGELIYSNNKISHNFANHSSKQDKTQSSGLSWTDDHVMINLDYVKMMQREDCSALQ